MSDKLDTDAALRGDDAAALVRRAFDESPEHHTPTQREAMTAWLACLEGASEIAATPAALQYERALIGHLLVEPKLISIAADVAKPDHFAQRELAAVLTAMTEANQANRQIDDHVLLDALQHQKASGPWPDVFAVCRKAYSGETNIGSKARAVFECWRNRSLAAIGAGLYHRAKGSKAYDAPKMLDEITTRLLGLELSTEARSSDYGIGELARQCVDNAAERAANGYALPGIPTGFPGLDSMIGGLERGLVTIIKADTGVGKTAIALSIAKKTAEHARRLPLKEQFLTAVVSLEMQAIHVGMRVLSNDSSVDGMNMRQGKLSDGEVNRMIASREQLLGLDDLLRVKWAPGMSLPAIRRHLQRLSAKFGRRLGLVVIDYLQLVSAGPSFRSREQEVAYLSTQFHTMAAEFGCHLIILSQVNADGAARESRRIEQDADTLIKLEPEDAAAEPEDLVFVYDLIVQKNRFGIVCRKGAYKVLFMKKYQRVVEMSGTGETKGTAWYDD